MIENWPWYISGAALAAVPVAHWLGLHRNLAVSGRFTAVVNRMRFGKTDVEVEVSQEELLEAIREATIAALGAGAVVPEEPTDEDEVAIEPPPRLSIPNHLVFLSMMLVGGALSALLAGGWSPTFDLSGAAFHGVFGDSVGMMVAVLTFGGVCVGFGTRMAAGCTTGHGLCGVSRFQKGSLAATAAFFGAAVVVSLVAKAVS